MPRPTRHTLTAALIVLATPALALIEPEPLEPVRPILTPVATPDVTIKVSAEEIDACRATLAAVLMGPVTGDAAHFNQTADPSLPVVRCVIEARAD